jgi:hypothetical protein
MSKSSLHKLDTPGDVAVYPIYSNDKVTGVDQGGGIALRRLA